MEAVRVLWERGISAVEVATGRTLSALESEWLAVVRQSDATGIEYPAE